MLEHTEQGGLGVILNRPSELPVHDAFPSWDDLSAEPPVLFLGGPVSQQVVIALGRPRPGHEPAGWQELLPDAHGPVGTFSLGSEPDELSTSIEALRVFAGYAGWAGGQLEDEIDAGAWFVADPEPFDAFSARPEDLWGEALRRQGGTTAFYANFPPDPSLN